MKKIHDILELKIFKRDLFIELSKWFDSKECIFITGSRQVGKTYLLYYCIQYLVRQNAIPINLIAFLDMENPHEFMAANSAPENLLKFLEFNGLDFSNYKKVYLFIDEIHLLDDPSKLIKILVDHYRNIKLFVSGSSSTDIRKKFKDSLVGRKLEFHLTSLSFSEYLIFNNKNNIVENILEEIPILFKKDLLDPNLLRILTSEIEPLFHKFLIFDGYPDTADISNISKVKRKLVSIFNDYIRKDISSLFDIDHLNHFTRLIMLIAHQTGGILNVSNIASDCELDRKTIYRYLEIMENTFIIKRLFPYFKKLKKRLIKSPKVYFLDNGIRNTSIQNFKLPANRSDYGAMVENYIFQILKRESALTLSDVLCFWRTSSGSEVDFIHNDIAIEVKSGNYERNPPRALIECMGLLEIKNAVILNKSVIKKMIIDNKTIIYYPYCLLK